MLTACGSSDGDKQHSAGRGIEGTSSPTAVSSTAADQRSQDGTITDGARSPSTPNSTATSVTSSTAEGTNEATGTLGASEQGSNSFGVNPGEGPQLGAITAGAYLAAGKGGQGYLHVLFNRPEPSPNTVTCTRETVGSCTASTCTQNGNPTPDSDYPNAGTIVFTSDGDFSGTAEPTANLGAYHNDTVGIFGGGERLSVSARGNQIEAFSGQFTLPLAPLLTSPEAPAGDERRVSIVPIVPGEDFSFSWDHRASANAILLRTESNLNPTTGESGARVECTFNSNEGRGVIDKALTAQLTAGSELHVYAYTLTPIQLTNGWLPLFGFYEMVTPDKMASPKFVVQ